MSRTIAIVSQKGGVGKTTTAVNLGASLAALHKRTLIIGHDPQCGVAVSFGFEQNSNGAGLYNFYLGQISLEQALKHTRMENLDIIPCNISSSEEELSFLRIIATDIFRLNSNMHPLRAGYDYISSTVLQPWGQ